MQPVWTPMLIILTIVQEEQGPTMVEQTLIAMLLLMALLLPGLWTGSHYHGVLAAGRYWMKGAKKRTTITHVHRGGTPNTPANLVPVPAPVGAVTAIAAAVPQLLRVSASGGGEYNGGCIRFNGGQLFLEEQQVPKQGLL
jgi:hypothetical protein